MKKIINYPRLAARLYNQPLLVEPRAAETISSALAERFGTEAMVEVADATTREPKARAFFDDEDDDEGVPGDQQGKPYMMAGGTALIPITGELINRGSWMDAASGLTSYMTVSNALRFALTDTAVTGILLDIDSPGGEASGCMELGALVRQVNATKTVIAFVDGHGCIRRLCCRGRRVANHRHTKFNTRLDRRRFAPYRTRRRPISKPVSSRP